MSQKECHSPLTTSLKMPLSLSRSQPVTTLLVGLLSRQPSVSENLSVHKCRTLWSEGAYEAEHRRQKYMCQTCIIVSNVNVLLNYVCRAHSDSGSPQFVMQGLMLQCKVDDNNRFLLQYSINFLVSWFVDLCTFSRPHFKLCTHDQEGTYHSYMYTYWSLCRYCECTLYGCLWCVGCVG